ncbi:hypothetical protein NDU88_006163 [Pleurodeles waltl]|uniref:Uncharacterized protein n=1 Tax=Pleurodeles waltl TaxID=8319 RepID=A0AAV7L664_PLEWA|nr:hypothetical protein NDU88_006161 [Pleurodeles waltl]KAJ1086039.1 hypothetical protein NDU88_006163 [Pleurodeles waltl]
MERRDGPREFGNWARLECRRMERRDGPRELVTWARLEGRRMERRDSLESLAPGAPRGQEDGAEVLA